MIAPTRKSLPAIWGVRIVASLVLLNGCFWTWFGLACAWPDPLCMLMHSLLPGLPLLALGVMALVEPMAAGAILVLWGVQPLLTSLLGIELRQELLSPISLTLFWTPLLWRVLLHAFGYVQKSAKEKQNNRNIE